MMKPGMQYPHCIDKGMLDAMQRTVGRNAFDSGDSAAFDRADSAHARIEGLPIDKDCTGAAQTFPAAVLRPGQAKVISQIAEQVAPGVRERPPLTVDSEVHLTSESARHV